MVVVLLLGRNQSKIRVNPSIRMREVEEEFQGEMEKGTG